MQVLFACNRQLVWHTEQVGGGAHAPATRHAETAMGGLCQMQRSAQRLRRWMTAWCDVAGMPSSRGALVTGHRSPRPANRDRRASRQSQAAGRGGGLATRVGVVAALAVASLLLAAPIGHAKTGTGKARDVQSPPTQANQRESEVDLAVSSIVPSATEPPKVIVIVRNIGSQPFRGPVTVELWWDEQSLGRQQLEEPLPPATPVSVVFLRPTELAPGLHNFTATIDPEQQIPERSKENNTLGITVWADGSSEGTP